MSKYRILVRPDGYDTSLIKDEYDTLDEAVREGISTYMGDFVIVQVIDWVPVTRAEEV